MEVSGVCVGVECPRVDWCYRCVVGFGGGGGGGGGGSGVGWGLWAVVDG